MFLHQKVHFKAVLGSIGLLLHVPAIMALISLVICCVFQEYYALMPFLATAVIGVALGQFLYRVFFKAHASHLWDAMIIASIGWLFISLIGALPIWWIANFCMTHDLSNSSVEALSSVTNALFESFSGFTSTGLTMIKLPEDLPRTLQWWRSFMQWVGGLGLMVFVLSLTHLFKEGYQLYYAEAHTEKIGKNVTSTSQVIWGIYLLYTVFGIILFLVLGMPIWESINHTMTLISTGGFSILNSNFQNYSSWIQLAGILIMIIGGINFAVHYHVIREGKVNALWKNAQQRNLYFFIFCGGVLIYLLNLWSGAKIPWLDMLFEWTSALTTCGLCTLTLNRFSSMGKLFLILGMFTGACAGSTAGGLKIQRLMHLFSGITLRVQTITEDKEQSIMKAYDPSAPQAQEPKEVDLPKNETTEKLYAAGVLFFLWMLTVVLGWLFMLKWVPSTDALATLFDVVSATSNAGLTSGIMNAEVHVAGKYIFMALMWLGRLEIIPALILILSLLFPVKKKA